MSFVCQFCGEYSERRPVKLTSTPDSPAGVACDNQTEICYQCMFCIENVESGSGCDWCDGDSLTQWVYRRRRRVAKKVGVLCTDCIRIGRGEYPVAFSTELKEKVRENNRRKCAECGMPEEDHKETFGQKLHVHHKDGNKRNNKMQNLTPLCARCHGGK